MISESTVDFLLIAAAAAAGLITGLIEFRNWREKRAFKGRQRRQPL